MRIYMILILCFMVESQQIKEIDDKFLLNFKDQQLPQDKEGWILLNYLPYGEIYNKIKPDWIYNNEEFYKQYQLIQLNCDEYQNACQIFESNKYPQIIIITKDYQYALKIVYSNKDIISILSTEQQFHEIPQAGHLFHIKLFFKQHIIYQIFQSIIVFVFAIIIVYIRLNLYKNVKSD